MDKLKLNKILLGFLTILTMSCYSQSDFVRISNDIYKRAITNNDSKDFKKIAKTENNIRKQIFKKGNLSFFEISEPLFILEGYDLETNRTITEIWNSKGYACYENNKKEYKLIVENYYSDDLKLLIKNWEIETIKKNIRDREKGIIGGLDIWATVIYFLENGEIDEIKSFSFSQYNGCMKDDEN